MFFAAKSGHLEIFKRLLRGGARVDIRDNVRHLLVSEDGLTVGGLRLEWSDS